MTDPHTVWAAAQLAPGEGIADGVSRIAELTTPDCRTCVHAYGKPLALGCSAIGACVAGERYEALPVAQLWRTT